jgi:hypothetical protein
LQTSIEIPARSLETLAEALAHTIGVGLLKQPDKQELPSTLECGHVCGLRAFCALHNLKFDRITFIQGSISFSHNRCVMNKDIWTVTAPDETIALRIVEPLHLTLH